jgi:hypothetical protein
MALIVKDRVLESSTSTGTGSFTLTGAQTGYQSFSAIGNGNTTYYTIQGKNPDGTLTGEWEVGEGTWSTGNTLARDTVFSNSLGTTAKIAFSAGDKDVFVTYPSDKALLGTTSAVASTGTGSVVLSASPTITGTLSAADLTTTGNTILGNASTDTLNVGNGGLVKDASGNVGIGASNLSGRLNINSNSASSVNIEFDTTSTLSAILSYNRNTSTYAQFNFRGSIFTFSPSDVERVRIHNSGGVSIGNTTDPGASNLLVAGAIVSTRITPRVSTTTSSATPTINTDTTDQFGLTAQAVDITSFTTNLSGTPTNGQKLWIYIVGTAARAITWGASFESSTATLPTTTVTTNRLDIGFVWNAATSKWRCVAVA